MAEKEYKLTKDAAGIDAALNGALRFDIAQDLNAREKAQVLETLGIDASKLDFKILGYFDTFDELEAAITSPEPGDAYGVGMAYPYDIYIWNNLRGRWVNNGPVRGADGEDGADAEVTAESIEKALGYTPADADEEMGFDRLKRTAKTLAWRNITVPDSAWEEAGTDPLYPWRAAIELPGSGVDDTYLPQAEFDRFSRENADLSPDCTSFDEGVFIYAAAAPEILVFIENITCEPTLVETLASSVFASIAVTYAAGATLTCTDGTTTLTAKSTSGRWTFAIPYAGTWLISDGENEQSVSITTQGQNVSVDLGNGKLWLFKSGTGAMVDFTIVKEDNCTITEGTESVNYTYSSLSYSQGTYYTSDINLEGYTKLKARVLETAQGEGDTRTAALFVSNNSVVPNAARNNSEFIAAILAESVFSITTEKTEYEIDLSALTGVYYMGITGGMKGDAYDIWLE